MLSYERKRNLLNIGSFHFLDQSFGETFAESYIRTETKDKPKSEVVFRLDSANRWEIRWAIRWDQTSDWAIAESKAT